MLFEATFQPKSKNEESKKIHSAKMSSTCSKKAFLIFGKIGLSSFSYISENRTL